MKDRWYGVALDASLQDFRYAAGPFTRAALAAQAAWHCCVRATAAAGDLEKAPHSAARRGDLFIMELRGREGCDTVVGPYLDRAYVEQRRNELVAMGVLDRPSFIGRLLFVYTMPSGMQAAVIEEVAHGR